MGKAGWCILGAVALTGGGSWDGGQTFDGRVGHWRRRANEAATAHISCCHGDVSRPC